VATAAGALLVARRAYTVLPDELAAVLARMWPEAPQPHGALTGGTEAASKFVARARLLVEEWLFTWYEARSSAVMRHRFEELRSTASVAVTTTGSI
jgi:predicted ATPase